MISTHVADGVHAVASALADHADPRIVIALTDALINDVRAGLHNPQIVESDAEDLAAILDKAVRIREGQCEVLFVLQGTPTSPLVH